MKSAYMPVLLAILILLSSCKTPQNRALQEEEQTFMEALALEVKAPEAKYHELGREVVKLLEDALGNPTDSAMLADMRAFSQKHRYPIQEIQDEFDLWFQHITHEERVAFLIRLDHQDYIVEMRKLEARFKKRASGKNGYWSVWEEVMGAVTLWRK
ncbi:MAG: hypothetical protein AB8F95_04840 [Bacteroidia bacterium]